MDKIYNWKFYYINTICPYCNHGAVGTKNYGSIYNPIQGKCNYYKCSRNIYLRKGTIFEINSKTPVSVLYNILKFWLIDEMNAKK